MSVLGERAFTAEAQRSQRKSIKGALPTHPVFLSASSAFSAVKKSFPKLEMHLAGHVARGYC
jgi:hypothetical protein